MSDITYDPEADAVYIHLADVRIASPEEACPFPHDATIVNTETDDHFTDATSANRRSSSELAP